LLLRPGEVCKIQRYDKISFENLYYRVCVWSIIFYDLCKLS
jgi:DNA-directed RNA polymerase subunit H (RpoH/RPB5)